MPPYLDQEKPGATSKMLQRLKASMVYIKTHASRDRTLILPFRRLYTYLFGYVRKTPIFLITGIIKNSRHKMTSLFIGTNYTAYQFAELAYSETRKVVKIGELRFYQVNPALWARACDLIVIRAEPALAGKFRKHRYLILPNVHFVLDLRPSMDSLNRKMSRRRRRDIAKLQFYDYSPNISEDIEDFEYFYRQMYLPYARRRFKKSAYIKTYDEMKAIFQCNGSIIFVRREDKRIAGILFQTIGRRVLAWSFGVHRGNPDFLNELASQAALYSLIRWSKDKKFETLDYGVSAPYMTDGVFRFKKEWGMHVTAELDQSISALGILRMNEGTLSFLERNPLIILEKRALKGIVFSNCKYQETEHNETFSRYYLPELESLVILSYLRSSTEKSAERPPTSLPSQDVLPSHPLHQLCTLLHEQGYAAECTELKGDKST